jgi:SOS response regulatory protein OraA/RecX
VLAKLKRRGVPSDLSFARKLYESEAGGIPGESAEVAALQRLLETRFRSLDRTDEKAVARAYRTLIQRGFTPSRVRDALRLDSTFFTQTIDRDKT